MEKPRDQIEAETQEFKKVIERHERMKARRQPYEKTWQDAYDYTLPRKASITTTRTEGSQTGIEVYDSTAVTSNEILAATLASILTPETYPFIELFFGIPKHDEDEEVQGWLQYVAHVIHAILNGSNFHTEQHENYLDDGAIGNSCMYIGDDKQNFIHCSARAMKEIFIEENNLGQVDIVHREYQWTPRQIVQEFGEAVLPMQTRKKYSEGKEEPCTIIHAVEPYAKQGNYFGFRSRYFLKEEMAKLSEKGFKEFPYLVSRWSKTAGEIYGRGPGTNVLSETKMVNAMMEAVIRGAQLAIAPPLAVQDDGVIGKVRLTPHGLTVVRTGLEKPIQSLLPQDTRIDFGQQMVEDVRRRLRSGFYVDRILLNDGTGPQKTAYETAKIVEEQTRFMSPMLGRKKFDHLRPLVERIFGIAQRRGLIPDPPEQVAGLKFEPRYSSMIARMQKIAEAENFNRALQAAAPLINAFPEAKDNINPDRALRKLFSIYGSPQQVMATAREVKEIRASRAKAQQAAMAQAQEQHEAAVVGQVGPTLVQSQQAQQQAAG